MNDLLRAMLPAIADTLHEHTSELQEGGCMAGENDTPELRARHSGVCHYPLSAVKLIYTCTDTYTYIYVYL